MTIPSFLYQLISSFMYQLISSFLQYLILIPIYIISISSFLYQLLSSFLYQLIPSFLYQYPHSYPLRLDSTLGDFTEMQWTRGDISFIYNGEDASLNQTLSVIALDNNKKRFQNLSLASGVSIGNQSS